MEKPQLWVLAGGNGSGKSTFYEFFLKPRGFPFINADVLAKHIDPSNPEAASYKAARLAADQRTQLLQERKTFCFETVFSHPSKIDFVAEAKASGYEIVLVYIHLIDPELNEARVSSRVEAGGHSVPSEKIHSRIPRTMRHIATCIPLVDTFMVFDNSDLNSPFESVLVIQDQQITQSIDSIPEWARLLLNPIE